MLTDSYSYPIDRHLNPLVEEIESNPTIRVLAGRTFRYPLAVQELRIERTSPLKFNVLEEFVLRSCIELDPKPEERELAIIFGLGLEFVETTVRRLKALGAIEIDSDDRLSITDAGRDFYAKGSVPRPPEPYPLPIFFSHDPLLRKYGCSLDRPTTEALDLPDLPELPGPADLSEIDINGLSTAIVDSGLGLHVPDKGVEVTGFDFTGDALQTWQTVSLFVLLDLLEEKTVYQARFGKILSNEASAWFTDLLEKSPELLQELLEVDANQPYTDLAHAMSKRQADETADADEGDAAESWDEDGGIVQNKRRTERYVEYREGTLLLPAGLRLEECIATYRDAEIRKAFLQCFEDARERIIIDTPWISEQVVDDDFVKLLKKVVKSGVFVVIGYGYSSSREQEERKPSPEVLEKLARIHTLEGIPGVCAFWLGNSHSKEVLVDDQYALSGSFNFLSYRGEYQIRGETIYKMQIPHVVEETRNHLGNKFNDPCRHRSLHYYWKKDGKEKNRHKAGMVLAAWTALGFYEQAVEAAVTADRQWPREYLLHCFVQHVRGASTCSASTPHIVALVSDMLAASKDYKKPQPLFSALRSLLQEAGLKTDTSFVELVGDLRRLLLQYDPAFAEESEEAYFAIYGRNPGGAGKAAITEALRTA